MQLRLPHNKATASSGIEITPKKIFGDFRWELGELGAPDKFIDASCGRVPKTVLGGHYMDYSPKRLKTYIRKMS